MLARGLALGLAFVVTWMLVGCSAKSCTHMGCNPALRIELTLASGSFADGVYEVSVQTASKSEDFHCNVNSLSGCGCQPKTGGSGIMTCLGGSTFWVSIIDRVSSANVVLSKDGLELMNRELVAPGYESSEPNGPDCAPTCYRAEAKEAL